MRLPSIAAFAVLGLASSVTRERRVSHPLALACRGKTHGHWAAAIRAGFHVKPEGATGQAQWTMQVQAMTLNCGHARDE